MENSRWGLNSPILITNADKTVDGPGHHSLLEHDGEYLIVYHRHDIPRTPNGLLRQICADRMTFDADGNIERVTPTHKGLGPLAKECRDVEESCLHETRERLIRTTSIRCGIRSTNLSTLSTTTTRHCGDQPTTRWGTR